MDFLIFSDSHGRFDRIGEVLNRQVTRPNAVFFCGDGLRDVSDAELGGIRLYTVQGNCDWFSPFGAQTEEHIPVNGHLILLTHGHLYGVKSGVGALAAHAARVGADIVLFGHTHLPFLQTLAAGEEVGGVRLTRPLYLFNPGSIGMDGSFGTLMLNGRDLLFSHGNLS